MSLIIPKREMIVRKSEALLNARYKLGELALKLISIIYSNVKRSDEINKRYEIKISDIAKMMNKNYGEIYNLLDEATNEMLENPVKIIIGEDNKGKKEWEKFNWISYAKYKKGVITFSISPDLKPYILELQQKFVKYRLENILNLKGIYIIRLYEILKDIFEKETRNKKKIKVEKIYTLLEFREMLEIPKSYQYSSHIKKLILEKAKKELKEKTDIYFEYEEIKTGRKVTHIKFFIYKNPKNYKEEEPTQKKEVSTTQPVQNNWNEWRKELLKKGDIIISFNDEIYKLKAGYLFKNDKLLSKENSLEIWQKLYANRDNLKIMSEDEYLQEQIKQAEEEENLRKYKGLKLGVLINGEDKEVTIYDIKNNNNSYTLYLQIFPEYTILNKEFSNLEELEEFIKITHTNYKNNIEKYIKKKQPSEEAMKKIEELQKKIKMS